MTNLLLDIGGQGHFPDDVTDLAAHHTHTSGVRDVEAVKQPGERGIEVGCVVGGAVAGGRHRETGWDRQTGSGHLPEARRLAADLGLETGPVALEPHGHVAHEDSPRRLTGKARPSSPAHQSGRPSKSGTDTSWTRLR